MMLGLRLLLAIFFFFESFPPKGIN